MKKLAVLTFVLASASAQTADDQYFHTRTRAGTCSIVSVSAQATVEIVDRCVDEAAARCAKNYAAQRFCDQSDLIALAIREVRDGKAKRVP